MKRSREEALTLELLEAIELREDVSQRRLADELGVALGLANSYLRRCVRKGLVKIQQAPANRYLYYLTPKGFAEKSRLTAQYLRSSFDYYHRAGVSIARCMDEIAAGGGRSVALGGMSELAEIASVRAHDFPIEIIGTLQPGQATRRFLGLPVWGETSEFVCDAILFTGMSNPDALYAALRATVAEDSIFVPEIIKPMITAWGHSNGPS